MNTRVPDPDWMENVTYDELSLGQSARLLRTVTLADIQAFAAVSGDINPAHLNAEYAGETMFHGGIAHGMLGAALIWPPSAKRTTRKSGWPWIVW